MKVNQNQNEHEVSEQVRSILRKPYAFVLIPDLEAGGFTAQIKEFPGCIAEGESADEAVQKLRSVADTWVEAALAQGMAIPEPITSAPSSGRVPLRLPPSLHARVKAQAAAENCSLNTYLVSIISAAASGQDACAKALEAIQTAAERALLR